MVDPTGYQIMVDGREKLVTEATREELMAAVVHLTDCLEALDVIQGRIGGVLRSFRDGKSPVGED